MKVKISGILKESLVDGPGIRYVIFAQGCKHNCPGCHNPHTHDFEGGYEIGADEIVENVLNSRHIDGVTFSGGDPFFQPKEFEYIAKKLKNKNIHIVAYTGFLYEDIINDMEMKRLLGSLDILIDGPFIKTKRTFKLAFRGSQNQRIIDVKASLKDKKIVMLNY